MLCEFGGENRTAGFGQGLLVQADTFASKDSASRESQADFRTSTSRVA